MNVEQNITKAAGGNKTFLKVIYGVIALVAVVLLTLSFVLYYYAPSSTKTTVDVDNALVKAGELAEIERDALSGNDAAIAKISSMLDEAGITEAVSRKQNSTIDKTGKQQKITATMGDGVTYTVMDFAADNIDYVIDSDTIVDMSIGDSNNEEQIIYASAQPANIIVVIPGEGNSAERDAVMLMTHYDTQLNSDGASSAAAAASMVGAIRAIKDSGATFKNDIVFAFTDSRYENSLGAYAMLNQFVGFDNVMSRVKAVFNFDAITTGGELSVIEISDNNGSLLSAVSASGASFRAEGAVSSLMSHRISSDFDIAYDFNDEVYDIQGVNFMMTGGKYSAGTASDTIDNVTLDDIKEYSTAMQSIATYFGSLDLNNITSSANASAVNWLGLNFVVHGYVLYALAAILTLLFIANIVIAVYKKSFSIKNTFKGLGVVVLTLAITLACLYAAYFIVGLLSAAFGAITINMLFTVQFLNPAILIPAMLLTMGISCGLYPVLKKAFSGTADNNSTIKAGDCARGSAFLLMLLGIVAGFAVQTISFSLLLLGIVDGIIMLVTSLVKRQFAAKFKYGIERLMLYAVAAVLALPFFVSATMAVLNFFPVIYLPVLMLIFGLMMSSVTAYFDYFKPVLSDAFYKLPKHTIPVVKTIVEEREDPIKKGKFETVTETRVVKEKVAWKYHNWFGVTVLVVLSMILLIVLTPVTAVTSANIDKNITTNHDYTSVLNSDAVFDNAIVAYMDITYGTDGGTYYLLVQDEEVYRTLRYYGDKGEYDYWNWTWDDTFNAYKMTLQVSDTPSVSELITSAGDSSSTDKDYTISPSYADYSQVKLNVTGLAAGDTITVTPQSESKTEFTVAVTNPNENVEVILPVGYGACTLSITSNSTSISVDGYEYYAAGTEAPGSLNDAYVKYKELSQYFEELGKKLNIGFILKDSD